MAVCRLVGWMILSAALLLIGAEIVRSLEAAGWASLTLGELWRRLEPAGIEASRAASERHLPAVLWDAAAAVSRLPAWAPPLALAALLFWACRRRPFRRRR